MNCSYAGLEPVVTALLGHTSLLQVSASEKNVASGRGADANEPCDGATHAWTVVVAANNPAQRFKAGTANVSAAFTSCPVVNGLLLCAQGSDQNPDVAVSSK